MLGNDFSSANTFPRLNFPSPSKTEQNTKPEDIVLCEQTASPDTSSLSRLHIGASGREEGRGRFSAVYCFFSQTL